MTAWSGGKGSNPRPVKNQQQFEQNWDAIFGKKDKPKQKILYVLCEGFVKSTLNGKPHSVYVHNFQLERLYKLKHLDYRLSQEEAHERLRHRPFDGLVIYLTPRDNGDYEEHLAELIGDYGD